MELKIDKLGKTETETLEYGMSWEGSRIISVAPEASIKEAATLMRDEQVGDVLVLETAEEGGNLLGIVTDRDIALCIANEENLEDLRVSDIMSESVITASTDDDVFTLIRLMKESGVTRLPLLNEDDEVVGVATARNLLEVLAKSFFDITQIAQQQQTNERSAH